MAGVENRQLLARYLLARCLAALLLVLLLLLLVAPLSADNAVAPDGVAGFVVSHMEFAFSQDAAETGACPEGMNTGYGNPTDVLLENPGISRKPDEIESAYARRVRDLAMHDTATKNFCLNPELGKPDPAFKVVTGNQVPVFGIDMDKGHSGEAESAQNCKHSDFVGMNGESGIDNQYFRVVGCTKGYQPTGLANQFVLEMLAGSWGILIELRGVENLQNDAEVEVGLYANGDPIRLSSARKPLPYSTYTVHPDSAYHASMQGQIIDGVLSTQPVDMAVPYVMGAVYQDRVLRDARLSLKLNGGNNLEGYLAGYAPVEQLYNVSVAPREGEDRPGHPTASSRITQIGIGVADAHTFKCEALYHALYQYADGHPHPETGECMSISTQYRIQAIPAFINSQN